MAVISYSPRPQKWFSLFTRGRNVCCPQLFSSYHHSPQPPPHSSLLHRTRAANERKELSTTCLIYSPPAAERPEVVYCRVSTSSLTPHSHNHWPRPSTYQNAVGQWIGGDDAFWSKNNYQLTVYWTDRFGRRCFFRMVWWHERFINMRWSRSWMSIPILTLVLQL